MATGMTDALEGAKSARTSPLLCDDGRHDKLGSHSHQRFVSMKHPNQDSLSEGGVGIGRLDIKRCSGGRPAAPPPLSTRENHRVGGGVGGGKFEGCRDTRSRKSSNGGGGGGGGDE